MNFIPTHIPDLWVLEPVLHTDARGHFYEAYNANRFKQQGLDVQFVQDNQSASEYGTIRGLHYQQPPYAQTKLIRVLSGEILDVVVDIRRNSPTYGVIFSILLSAENKKQLLIPKGMAHGFSVQSPSAEVIYKCDAFYNKESEAGILYNDSALCIDWRITIGAEIVSEKDMVLPVFSAAANSFVYTNANNDSIS